MALVLVLVLLPLPPLLLLRGMHASVILLIALRLRLKVTALLHLHLLYLLLLPHLSLGSRRLLSLHPRNGLCGCTVVLLHQSCNSFAPFRPIREVDPLVYFLSMLRHGIPHLISVFSCGDPLQKAIHVRGPRPPRRMLLLLYRGVAAEDAALLRRSRRVVAQHIQ